MLFELMPKMMEKNYKRVRSRAGWRRACLLGVILLGASCTSTFRSAALVGETGKELESYRSLDSTRLCDFVSASSPDIAARCEEQQSHDGEQARAFEVLVSYSTALYLLATLEDPDIEEASSMVVSASSALEASKYLDLAEKDRETLINAIGRMATWVTRAQRFDVLKNVIPSADPAIAHLIEVLSGRLAAQQKALESLDSDLGRKLKSSLDSAWDAREILREECSGEAPPPTCDSMWLVQSNDADRWVIVIARKEVKELLHLVRESQDWLQQFAELHHQLAENIDRLQKDDLELARELVRHSRELSRNSENEVRVTEP